VRGIKNAFHENRYNNQQRMVIESCFSKTRVWGFNLENEAIAWGSSWLSSTSRWACGYRCDGTALGLLVGRFNTPDPSSHSVHPKSPASWNRYAYVGGDPVNHNDPRGLDQSVCSDPGNPDCPAPTAPDPCFDLSLDLFDGGVNCGAPVDSDDGDDASSGDDSSASPPPCDPKYQAYINSYGAYAAATGLSEANVLALSSIESDWGNGRFAKGGNSFFNLETLAPKGWKPKDPWPTTIYDDQLSWMNALEPFLSGPNKGRYSLVATYRTASDAFKSFAARDRQYLSGVTDPATFGTIAANHGIYAGRGQGFLDREAGFQDCLTAQKQ